MMKNLSKMLLIVIAMAPVSSCHALVVMAAKRTQGVHFSFGVMPKYIARRSTWTSSFQEVFKAAFLIGPKQRSLVVPGADALLPANEDRARSFLEGSVQEFNNALGLQRSPSKAAIETALFGNAVADRSVRAFIPLRDNTAMSGDVEKLFNLSHTALEFFAGISYSFHEHFGVWCRGGYVFPINLFKDQENDKIQNLSYSLKDMVEQVDTAQAGQTMSVNVMERAFSKTRRLLDKTNLTVSVKEGFSLMGGVVFTPVEKCSVELGLGIRQYTAKASFEGGVVATPHGNQYTDNFAASRFMQKLVPVEVTQTVYPILLHFGFIYTMERFHMGISLDYSSFSVDLSANNSEAKTSDHVKSFAGAVQTYSSDGATPVLRDLGDVTGFSMTHLGSVSARLAVRSCVRDISVGIRLGVTF